MRMHHRLYNPAPRRRHNARKADPIEIGKETIHISTTTGAPDFLYTVKKPSVKGDSYDYVIKSLGGMELRSGSAKTEREVKKELSREFGMLTVEFGIERRKEGIEGAFEAQTYTDVEPLFPGQMAESPVEEYEGIQMVVRREHPGWDEAQGYYFYVATADGQYVGDEIGPVPSRGEAEAQAHLAAGFLAGTREVLQSNPATRKKIKKWVDRKWNPAFGDPSFLEQPIRAAEITKAPLGVGIPTDPQQAALMGYYMGVLRGIKTCGVTKVIERFKIRRRIKKLLEEALHEQAEAVIAPRLGQRVRKVY